jgi:hydrogenase 3 maturation protease
MSLREELERRLKGNIVLVGVGNPMCGDDGVGPAVIQRLNSYRHDGTNGTLLVDGGDSPEAYWGKITASRPQAILLIDAVAWGGEPGSVALLERVQEGRSPLSTHRIPLNVFLDLLREETGADVFVLGIQPAQVAFGVAMSLRVQRTLDLLVEVFSDVLAGGVRCS